MKGGEQITPVDIQQNALAARKGVREWAAIISPWLVLVVGGLFAFFWSADRIDQKLVLVAEQFEKDLRRIETNGSFVSIQNSKDIVRLQTSLEDWDRRLQKIEDGQAELIRLMTK